MACSNADAKLGQVEAAYRANCLNRVNGSVEECRQSIQACIFRIDLAKVTMRQSSAALRESAGKYERALAAAQLAGGRAACDSAAAGALSITSVGGKTGGNKAFQMMKQGAATAITIVTCRIRFNHILPYLAVGTEKEEKTSCAQKRIMVFPSASD